MGRTNRSRKLDAKRQKRLARELEARHGAGQRPLILQIGRHTKTTAPRLVLPKFEGPLPDPEGFARRNRVLLVLLLAVLRRASRTS